MGQEVLNGAVGTTPRGTENYQVLNQLDLSQGGEEANNKDARAQSPMIPGTMTPGGLSIHSQRSKYRSPKNTRGGSLDQGSPSTSHPPHLVNSDPVRMLIRKLRQEKRER